MTNLKQIGENILSLVVAKGPDEFNIHQSWAASADEIKALIDEDPLGGLRYLLSNGPDGLAEDEDGVRNHDARIPECEAFVAATKARIVFGGLESCFDFEDDYIRFPKFERFDDAHAYYAIMFHELGHWAGGKGRLNRPKDTIRMGRRGSKAYSHEEVIAELTSAFLCDQFGFPRAQEHADYIHNYFYDGLKSNKEDFDKAVDQAITDYEYLIGFSKQKEEAA